MNIQNQQFKGGERWLERVLLELVGKELTTIFENLGNDIKGIIWGEGVWHKGEVMSTQAMIEAYEAGKNV